MKKASKKRAVTSKNASSNWAAWFVIGLMIIIGGWYYLKGGIVGSQAGTGGDVVYVMRDSSSPLSALAIGGTSKQRDSVWRFAYSSDDPNPERKVLLAGVTFTVSNATKVADMAYVRNYSASSTSQVLAAVPVTSNRIKFLFKKPIPINNNAVLRLEVLLDLNQVDGTAVVNDTPYTTRIVLPGDVLLLPNASGNPVVKVDQSNLVTNYLFSTKPAFKLNANSPSGALVPGVATELARFNVTADATGDIGFVKTGSGYANLETVVRYTVNDVQKGNYKISLTDRATGVKLAEMPFSVLAGTHEVAYGWVFYLPIAAGTTKTLSVYANTTQFEDINDAIRVHLPDKDSAVTWRVGVGGVTNQEGVYHHGRILFRGGIYGNVLVKQ